MLSSAVLEADLSLPLLLLLPPPAPPPLLLLLLLLLFMLLLLLMSITLPFFLPIRLAKSLSYVPSSVSRKGNVCDAV